MASAGQLGPEALERLDAWLARSLPELGRLKSIDKFPGGQSNPTYRLSCNNRTCVLRRRPFGTLLPKAHMIEREFRVMSALRGSAVPVPAMLAYCDDTTVIGAAFYVMEHLEGRIFWEPAMPGTPDQRRAIFDAMNQTVAALHAIDPAAVGLESFGRPAGFMARQVRLWSDQYRASQTDSIAAMDNLMQWLPEHLPPETATPRIFHGDLRVDNMIFHATEPRVIALLDWELSTLGDPMADLAYHMLSWRVPPQLFRGLAGLDLAALGIPTEREYLETYLARTHQSRCEHWPFFLAFGLFRLASILQGIAKRAKDGNASADDAAELGSRCAPLAEIAWAIVQ